MKVLVQKCSFGSVTVVPDYFKSIGIGYVLFVGFTSGDTFETIQYLAKKVANLRIFEDENGVMNKSILQVGGTVLSISQFTLYANAEKGNRPSYQNAMPSQEAKELYDAWNIEIQKYVPIETGIFGADMQVEICNIGPTTILLEK